MRKIALDKILYTICFRELTLIKSFKSSQFLTFLLTGGIAAAVNFLSRIIYNIWLDFSTAIVLAYCTGMVTAFVLAKLLVFKESTQPLHKAASYFVLVNIFAIAQTWLISMGLYHYVLPAMNVSLFAAEIAHGVGVMVPAFTSFLGHKHLSFKSDT